MFSSGEFYIRPWPGFVCKCIVVQEKQMLKQYKVVLSEVILLWWLMVLYVRGCFVWSIVGGILDILILAKMCKGAWYHKGKWPCFKFYTWAGRRRLRRGRSLFCSTTVNNTINKRALCLKGGGGEVYGMRLDRNSGSYNPVPREIFRPDKNYSIFFFFLLSYSILEYKFTFFFLN